MAVCCAVSAIACGSPPGGAPDAAPPSPPSLGSQDPLVAFVPLQTDPGSPPGSVDYDELFQDGAPWSNAASKIGLFGVFGGWTRSLASDARLDQVISDLARRGIPLGVEAGMIETAPACADGIEGVVHPSGYDAGIASRIHSHGGAVRVIRADDPFSSQLLAGNPCGFTASDVARFISVSAGTVRAIEPDVRVEITETLSGPVAMQDLLDEIDAFATIDGHPLGAFHLDIDYSRPQWATEARALEDAVRQRGVRFGVIYHGEERDGTDAAWTADAEQRAYVYELEYGGHPDEVDLESWMSLPTHVLPETTPGTFTNLVGRYFRPRPHLTATIASTILTANLADAAAAPIAGAPIRVTMTPTSGPGLVAHYSASGTIPAGATRAVVGLRVNEECGCAGTSDVRVYDASLTTGGDPTNLVPDHDFSAGAWPSSGSGSVTLEASDAGAGEMMHVSASPTQMLLVQTADIPVTGGSSYAFDVTARVSPASIGSGYFTVIFLDAAGELVRTRSSFAPASVAFAATTDSAGVATIDLGTAPTGQRIDVWYDGDDDRYAAYALAVAPP
jgi:hypothetical protein